MILNPLILNPLFFFVLSLDLAYPQTIRGFSFDESSVILNNGEKIKMVSNDSYHLCANDILSIFLPIYIIGKDHYVSDAGRTRPYYILNAVYGRDKKEIEKNLVEIKFLSKILKFNKKNNAALNLKRALEEIEVLIKEKPELLNFVKEPQTYNYRVIAGENVLSAHSYGIAIDFVYNGMGYWRYNERKDYVEFPFEIVEIMEKYGFIWGGKWEHFDTMHFEYRPEFLFINKIIRMGE